MFAVTFPTFPVATTPSSCLLIDSRMVPTELVELFPVKAIDLAPTDTESTEQVDEFPVKDLEFDDVTEPTFPVATTPSS